MWCRCHEQSTPTSCAPSCVDLGVGNMTVSPNQVAHVYLAPDFVAYAQKQHMYRANNNNKKPWQK